MNTVMRIGVLSLTAAAVTSMTAPCLAKKPSPVQPANGATVKRSASASRVDLASVQQFKQASALFDARQYAQALDLFENMDKSGFCCDLLHYYIACSYHHLNQVQKAQKHYRMVASSTVDPILKRYSESGSKILAYYSDHRFYDGQGNDFSRVVARPPCAKPKEQPLDVG
ncbi:MAG TPA: hypothetical protein V6C72_16215 [Chroococcales cyanobacterium]